MRVIKFFLCLFPFVVIGGCLYCGKRYSQKFVDHDVEE